MDEIVPRALLADLVDGERRAVGIFRTVSRSPLLSSPLQGWARRIAGEEIGHARIAAFWLKKLYPGPYSPHESGSYLQSGRQSLTPNGIGLSEAERVILGLGWVWRAEIAARQHFPKWAQRIERELPEFAKDLRGVAEEESDHLRFHRKVWWHLDETMPEFAGQLLALRLRLLLEWPKIEGLEI